MFISSNFSRYLVMLCELRQAGLDLLGPSLLSPGRVGISAVMWFSVPQDFLDGLLWRTFCESVARVGASAACQGDGLTAHIDCDQEIDFGVTRDPGFVTSERLNYFLLFILREPTQRGVLK